MFFVTKQFVEGVVMLCVARVDGKTFHGGIISYNFDLDCRDAAQACCDRLNQLQPIDAELVSNFSPQTE